MWARIVTVLLGVWLMISPPLLNFDRTTADTINRIVGPIVIVLAILALRDVTHLARFALLLPALFLLLAPWFLHYTAGIALANDEVIAMLLVIFAVLPTPIRQRTGGGWLGLLEPELPGNAIRELVEGGPE